ncbi:MAG: hypothetical protein HPY58_07625 [Firmicutes bacterium]|nr:hypothetical protein [Bacillota bacterium]
MKLTSSRLGLKGMEIYSQIRPAFRLPARCGAGYNERQKKPFAGILTPEEADSMERAIEEGCERVSP